MASMHQVNAPDVQKCVISQKQFFLKKVGAAFGDTKALRKYLLAAICQHKALWLSLKLLDAKQCCITNKLWHSLCLHIEALTNWWINLCQSWCFRFSGLSQNLVLQLQLCIVNILKVMWEQKPLNYTYAECVNVATSVQCTWDLWTSRWTEMHVWVGKWLGQ